MSIGLTHITFANKYYYDAAESLRNSSKQYGVDTIVMNEMSLPDEFYATYKEHFRSVKGFGYWIWKPYIILKMMEQMPKGEILLYTDAGCSFTNHPSYLLRTLEGTDIGSFEVWGHPNNLWTKPSVFLEMGLNSEDFQQYQRAGGYLIIRVSELSVAILSEWFSLVKKLHLVNDDEINTNPDDYYHHRHDQSLLSIVLKKHNIPGFRDPSQFGNRFKHLYSNSPYPQVINSHRRGRLPLMLRLEKSLSPRFDRVRRRMCAWMA